SYRHIVVAEYSGVSTSSPFIKASQTLFTEGCTNFSSMYPCTSGDFEVTCGRIETSIPGALIVGMAMNSSGHDADRASGPDFTLRASDTNPPALDLQDRVLSAGGETASTEIWQLNANYIACVMAFAPNQ